MKSKLRKYKNIVACIEALAIKRGSEFGLEKAEAFSILRNIII